MQVRAADMFYARWIAHSCSGTDCSSGVACEHIAVAGDTENIQSVWPQLRAYASHMPDERTARVAVRGTHAEALLQEVKGKMAFVLPEQAHHERVLSGSAVHDRAIDDE